MSAVIVYVPTSAKALADIARGSAIVGRPRPGASLVLAYYEGNIYGSQNLLRFAERVASAADRLDRNYPTSSMIGIPPKYLIPVGEWDIREVRIYPQQATALADWLGVTMLGSRELVYR